VVRRLRLARYWLAKGDLDEAAHDAHRALRVARRHPAVPATLTADVALTVARIEQGCDDLADRRTLPEYAINVLESAPESADRDRLLGWALLALGDWYRSAGEYPTAEETLNRALRLVQLTESPDPVLHAAVLNSQGITAKELGAFDEAALRYELVSTIHRETGATQADAATLEHNLAGLQYSRRSYAQAEAHARRALALRRQVPGVTRVELAADLAVLASALAAQGGYDEARTLLLQALAACQEARPPRRYEIAVQLHNLADVEHGVGRLDEAEDLYRQALSLKQQLLGIRHPEVGLVANNLGTLLQERGRDDEAADCHRRALIIAERAYPASHPVIADIRRHLESDLLGSA
jgi:tetratricopeptide (TPR) repeat protein